MTSLEKAEACRAALAEMRKACEAATPGPWFGVIRVHEHDGYAGYNIEPTSGPDIAAAHEYPYYCIERAQDAAFIAQSRSWLPALLDYAEDRLNGHISVLNARAAGAAIPQYAVNSEVSDRARFLGVPNGA